ncbi:SecDF P1 head subdomain-containing protein [Actinocorallia longicatena]|uniref:SecDF P1 head subdomain domain-containing protein n=1 Tax=Actinocorallia longicatena TaxID=111803 RepID=A0ABP6QMU7_9ACTN
MRRPAKTTLLASIIVIGLCSAAVVMTGVLIAVARSSQTTLATPLSIYPVAGATSGRTCQQVGVAGFDGPEPACYQINEEGLKVTKVGDVKVKRLPDDTFGLSVQLIGADKKKFGEITRSNLQKQLALVVNGRVVTAPKVDSPITGGGLLITGQFTRPAADKLAHDLTGT